MPSAIFVSKLKAGVSRSQYEQWVRDFDYPHVEQIPSILSQRIHTIDGAPVFGKLPDFDYVEIIEFTNVGDYLNDLANHPAAQAISAQLPNFVEVSLVASSFATFVPPGVSR